MARDTVGISSGVSVGRCGVSGRACSEITLSCCITSPVAGDGPVLNRRSIYSAMAGNDPGWLLQSLKQGIGEPILGMGGIYAHHPPTLAIDRSEAPASRFGARAAHGPGRG